MRRKRKKAATAVQVPILPAEHLEARRLQMQQVFAAAALEQYASLHPVSAWDVAGKMPEAVQAAVCVAARGPIGDARRRSVRALLAEWRARPDSRGVIIREKVNANL